MLAPTINFYKHPFYGIILRLILYYCYGAAGRYGIVYGGYVAGFHEAFTERFLPKQKLLFR